jgi:hypothetical protein
MGVAGNLPGYIPVNVISGKRRDINSRADAGIMDIRGSPLDDLGRAVTVLRIGHPLPRLLPETLDTGNALHPIFLGDATQISAGTTVSTMHLKRTQTTTEVRTGPEREFL